MGEVGLTPAQRSALVAAAIAAPSADNRPFCVFDWAGDTLEIRDRGEFTHPEPHRRVLARLALGAVATNLEVRASRLGLQPVEMRWHEAVRKGDLVAQLTFSGRDKAADASLDDAISQRCSNRRPDFRGQPLAPAAQQQLSQEVAAFPGATLHWLDAAPRRRHALALIRQAETQRFRIEALHRELFDSIRFDVGWAVSTDTGIPSGALGLPMIERLGFPLLRHWWLQRAANLLGTHRIIGWRAADLPCRLSPHLCAITVQGQTAEAAIQAGRALQAAWLRATNLGMAFQVFAASPLYAMEGLQVVPASIQAGLRSGWAALCGPDTVYIVFRMGHAQAPEVRAGRPGAKDKATWLPA